MQYIAHGTKDFKKIDRNLHLQWGAGFFGVPTPEFGISEKVSDFFGQGRTSGGGSNLFGDQKQTTLVPTRTGSFVPSGTSGAYGIQSSYTPSTVLGASTSVSAPTSGGGGQSTADLWRSLGNTGDVPVGWNGPGGGEDLSAQVRNDINSGYDQYFGQLDDIMNNGLPTQRAAQEGIADSQYQQGVNTLGSQRTLGLNELGGQREKATSQQNKTLQDLSENIRNLFQSGNVYLGARGAADSSASNQYAYALTKMGSKERGNVTSQYADINNDINDREFRLNETFNTESNNLKLMADQKKSEIAQWFSEQQNALKMAKAQGQLSRGQDLASLSKDLLNVALQRLQGVEQDVRNRQSALQEWAMNNSTTINQLKQNLAQVSQTNYQMPQASPVGGMPAVAGGQGNPSLFGYGVAQDEQRKRNSLFG